MVKFVEIQIKEYYYDENKKVLKDVYIFQEGDLKVSFEQIEGDFSLPEILRRDILDETSDETCIVKLFKATHYPPGHPDEYNYRFFIFSPREKQPKPLHPSKDFKINLNLPLQIPEEIELSFWREDYRDWGGAMVTEVYLKQSLEDMLQAKKISFYKKEGEGYTYWTSPSQGRDLGKLYKTGVLQDILKILGVKKIKVKEHERKYYHPTSSHLFGLKDKGWEDQFEIDLENWNIKNKYIVIQDKLNKIEIYVELEA